MTAKERNQYETFYKQLSGSHLFFQNGNSALSNRDSKSHGQNNRDEVFSPIDQLTLAILSPFEISVYFMPFCRMNVFEGSCALLRNSVAGTSLVLSLMTMAAVCSSSDGDFSKDDICTDLVAEHSRGFRTEEEAKDWKRRNQLHHLGEWHGVNDDPNGEPIKIFLKRPEGDLPPKLPVGAFVTPRLKKDIRALARKYCGPEERAWIEEMLEARNLTQLHFDGA
eukprot:g62458.t1